MFTLFRRKLYSVKQAARLLTRSEDYVRRLCRQGQLRARKNGNGEWRIEQRSVRDYRRRRESRDVPNRVGTFSSALISGAVSVIFIVIVQTVVRPHIDLDGPTKLTLYFLILSLFLAISFFILYARYRRRSFLRVFYAALTTIVLITFSISFAEAIARSFLQATSSTLIFPTFLPPANDSLPLETASPPKTVTALSTASKPISQEIAGTPLPPEQGELENLLQQVTHVRATAEALSVDTAEENRQLDILQATTEALVVVASGNTATTDKSDSPTLEEDTRPGDFLTTPEPIVLEYSTGDEATPLRFTLDNLATVTTLILAVLTAISGTIGWIFSQYFKVLEFRLKEQEVQLKRMGSKKVGSRG
jgi:excisionase family DNA binding protein